MHTATENVVTDDRGRRWALAVKTHAVKRIDKHLGVRLDYCTPAQLFSWLADVVGDRERLLRVVFTIVYGQRPPFDDFAAEFSPETLQAAVPCLLRAFAEWTPSEKVRAGLLGLAARYEGDAP